MTDRVQILGVFTFCTVAGLLCADIAARAIGAETVVKPVSVEWARIPDPLDC